MQVVFSRIPDFVEWIMQEMFVKYFVIDFES